MSAREIHVLFFGDSHTVGVGEPSGLGWVGLIVAATHAAGISLVAYNLGVRGETSREPRLRGDSRHPLSEMIARYEARPA